MLGVLSFKDSKSIPSSSAVISSPKSVGSLPSFFTLSSCSFSDSSESTESSFSRTSSSVISMSFWLSDSAMQPHFREK